MAKAMLFDVEGTLIDSVPATLRCWQETLRAFGFEFSIDELQAHSGQDGHDMLRALLPSDAERLSDELLKVQGERYREQYLPRVHAFPAVRALFQNIKQSGRPIALATTCAGDELHYYEKLMDVADLVDAVACGEDVKHDKPDPALLQLALTRLGARPEESVMVGDTPYDALAARRTGVVAIGMLSGGFSRKALQAAGCAPVIRDPADLLGRLENASALIRDGRSLRARDRRVTAVRCA